MIAVMSIPLPTLDQCKIFLNYALCFENMQNVVINCHLLHLEVLT